MQISGAAEPFNRQLIGARNFSLFLLMSLIWGATWVPIKVGIAEVPPIFFAAMRYTLTAVILSVTLRNAVTLLMDTGNAWRMVVTGVLINTAGYSLLFWGMQFVSSGTAGLINLSLIPVGLFACSIAFGLERARWQHALALGLGLVGLAVLFADKATATGSQHELWGAAAVVAATACYCFGSVLSRPLLEAFTPIEITAAHAIIGAVGLLALSLTLEPISAETWSRLALPAPLGALAFLVIFGTITAYAIYLRLVRDWGASRSGLYAFLSPIAALVLGWVLLDEAIGWREGVGAALMLTAAALALLPGARSATA
jgi:drug/metabolite transporter (DMT)-like permease